MDRKISTIVLTLVLTGVGLGGCSSSKPAGTSTSQQPPAAVPASTGSGAGGATADAAACSGGLTGSEPGVVSVTCDGPAEIRIQAGSVSKDLHGGRCQSGGGVWSANVGVLIDETGLRGKYTGPKVDNVAVNNTAGHGKGTIQALLGGVHYYALGTASLTLSADGKTAHLSGVSDKLSDAPGAKIVVDITC